MVDLFDVETMRGEEARVELQIQMLRLCGNSCADIGVAFSVVVSLDMCPAQPFLNRELEHR